MSELDDVTAALATTAAKYDATGEFPAEGLRVVHEAGLLTATVGEAYGGRGAGVSELARILLALGRGDPSVALIASMTLFPHLLQARHPHWPADLYASVLARPGPVLLNNCRVEPELGSPSRGGLPATTARRTAEGWSISGRKRFVTGAAGLTYFLVWAATDEPSPRVGTFVVPGDSAGIEVIPAWDQLGLRASGSHDVAFADVPVPRDHVLGLVPADAEAQQDNLAGGALHLPLAALYVGVARAAQQAFHRFAHERVPANLGRPVASTDRFRSAAGEIEVLLTGAERLILDATGRFDRGEDVPGTAALGARVLASRHAVAAVTLAVRLLGNPGLSRADPLERHFRDVQSALVHAPQEDTALLVIGTAALAR
jgi:alkylation response protein AidB-like acyl-CoA dehydrogenase